MTVIYFIKPNYRDDFIVGENHLQEFCKVYAEEPTDDAVDWVRQHAVKFIEIPIYSDFEYVEV